MTHCQSDPDAHEIFLWHFQQYADHAGREALLDAAAAEDDPQELIREYRFHGLLNLFTASFRDSSDAIPGFLPAARRAMRCSNSRDRGNTREVRQPESTAAE